MLTERKASFKKRTNGLVKKVVEVSTLCGVDACVVVHSEDNMLAQVWPSRERALQVYSRYLDHSEVERDRVSFNPVTYTEDRINKMKEQIARLQKTNKQEQTEQFVWKSRVGLVSSEEFHMQDDSHLMSFIKQKSDGFMFRMEELQQK